MTYRHYCGAGRIGSPELGPWLTPPGRLGMGPLTPFYSELGRLSVDPKLMIRMLIVGYCYGIRYERRLCEEIRLHE
jgi:hypothetical protein